MGSLDLFVGSYVQLSAATKGVLLLDFVVALRCHLLDKGQSLHMHASVAILVWLAACIVCFNLWCKDCMLLTIYCYFDVVGFPSCGCRALCLCYNCIFCCKDSLH